MKRAPEAIIFDFDGTIVDTEPVWRRACMSIYHDLGVPMTDALMSETSGMPMSVALPYWFKRFPWKDTRSIADLAHETVRRVLSIFEKDGPVLRDGAKELLSRASEVSQKMAICSSSPESFIRSSIDALGVAEYFSVIRSSDSDGKHKPDPAVYLSTVRLLGATKSACVAIEDSVAGVTSACDAGVRCIAVPDARFVDLKKVSRADFVALSLNDVTRDVLLFP